MRFEEYSDEDRAAVAGLVQLITLGAGPIGRAVVAFAVAERHVPSDVDSARRRLRTQARAIARLADRFATTDLGAALLSYVEWSERTGGAEDPDRLTLERRTVGLITAALAYDRTGDDSGLEAAARELVRDVYGDDY